MNSDHVFVRTAWLAVGSEYARIDGHESHEGRFVLSLSWIYMLRNKIRYETEDIMSLSTTSCDIRSPLTLASEL